MSRRRARVWAVLSTVGTFTASTLLVWHASFAAFSATTTNPTSTFSAAARFAICQSVATADSAYLTYPMAEASGTSVTDTAGNSRTGTYKTGVTYRTAGPCPGDSGYAVTFNGSTGYAVTPSVPYSASDSFTEEAWFKTTATSTDIIGMNDVNTGAVHNGSDRMVYLTTGGNLAFAVDCSADTNNNCYAQPGGTGTTNMTTATYNDNTWHLVDATLTSGTMSLYVDGTRVAYKTSIGTDAGGYTSGAYYYFGGACTQYFKNLNSSSNCQPPLNGSMAFGSTYTTALTATQITNHYNAGH